MSYNCAVQCIYNVLYQCSTLFLFATVPFYFVTSLWCVGVECQLESQRKLNVPLGFSRMFRFGFSSHSCVFILILPEIHFIHVCYGSKS